MLVSRSRSFVLSMMAIGLLTGCATLPNNPLSQQEIDNLRINRVKVTFEPNAAVIWPKVEQEYVSALPTDNKKLAPVKAHVMGGIDKNLEYASKAATPKAKMHLRQRLAALLKTRMTRDVLGEFQGGRRPAELRIRVRAFVIPSPVHRVLVNTHPALTAITSVHDANTGKELASMNVTSAGYAGGGLVGVAVDQLFSDLDERVMAKYTSDVRNWLKAKQ